VPSSEDSLGVLYITAILNYQTLPERTSRISCAKILCAAPAWHVNDLNATDKMTWHTTRMVTATIVKVVSPIGDAYIEKWSLPPKVVGIVITVRCCIFESISRRIIENISKCSMSIPLPQLNLGMPGSDRRLQRGKVSIHHCDFPKTNRSLFAVCYCRRW